MGKKEKEEYELLKLLLWQKEWEKDHRNTG